MVASNSTSPDIGTIGQFAVGEFYNSGFVAPPFWPNLSLPVRHKIAPALAIALIASGSFSGPLFDQGGNTGSYTYPWSEPVRQKPGVPAYLQQSYAGEIQPSILSAQAWFAPLSEPVRLKPGTKASNQQFLAYVAARTQNFPLRSGEINFAEETQFSKYSYAWSDPVRIKQGVKVQNQDALVFEEVPPIEMMAAWYDWLSEPVRQKKGLGSHLQMTWAFDTTPVPTGRYYGWFAPLSEPVRQKPGLKVQLQRSFTQDADPVPLQRGMAWFSPLRDPVKLKPGLRADLQDFYTVDEDIVPGAAKLVAWFQWFREPVRKLEGLKTHLQQFLAYHPRILPNPTVTMVMDAIETNNDVALFGVNVYSSGSSSASGQGARVSITEVAGSGGDPVSIRES